MKGAAELGSDVMSGVPADEQEAAAGIIGEFKNVATDRSVFGGGLEEGFFDFQVVVVNLEPIAVVGFTSSNMENFTVVQNWGKDFTGGQVD